MIRYALKCPDDHGFESWFQSAVAFDGLRASGHLSCPVCGSASVEKTLMAPVIRPARKAGEAAPPTLSQPENDRERALAVLRAKVEANSEYVGMNFVTEARAIHDGDAPERSIYGEARPDEAIKLLQDGVPVAPLPFMPARKAH
ncbi:MAG: DUF1178 family protein [Paracoccaceae bacterium]